MLNSRITETMRINKIMNEKWGDKKVLSITEKERITRDFELNERGITSFAWGLLDSGAGLVLAGFGTKIISAISGVLRGSVGKKFRLPVSAFSTQVKFNSDNNITGSGDKTEVNDFIEVYNKIEELIEAQVSLVANKNSIFAYLNRIRRSNPLLKKAEVNVNIATAKSPKFSPDGKTMQKEPDIYDLINTKDPKDIEKILKVAMKKNDKAIIDTKVIDIMKKIKEGKDDQLANATMLKKYDINTYKTIEIGGKKFTDLRSYIAALMELSAVNKGDIEELDKNIATKFPNFDNSNSPMKGDKTRVTTVSNSNYSWMESRLIAGYLQNRYINLLKIRNNRINAIKAQGKSSFKSRADRDIIRKQEKNKPLSSFYYDGKPISDDVVGELVSVSPINGSAKEFLQALKKESRIKVEFIFKNLSINGASTKTEDTDQENDKEELTQGNIVSAEIAMSDLLLFFQKITGNLRINLLKIIKTSRDRVNDFTDYRPQNKDKKDTDRETRPVGRPTKDSKDRRKEYKIGGFSGGDVFGATYNK